jgi:hydrogenase nickel incorporation protein HypA/HybF
MTLRGRTSGANKERNKETMHELSIAMSIVELAEEEAERRGVQVTAVHLKLGLLSGVVKDALLSCYEMACEGTPLQGSCLLAEDVPVVIFCPSCRAERPLNSIQLFCCPECGTPASEVVQGKELEVVAMEIQECAPNRV